MKLPSVIDETDDARETGRGGVSAARTAEPSLLGWEAGGAAGGAPAPRAPFGGDRVGGTIGGTAGSRVSPGGARTANRLMLT